MFSTLFPSQDEKRATVNVYWGHWEGSCLHWILPLGTHTHTHITYGSCVPITQHKTKKHTSLHRHKHMKSHLQRQKQTFCLCMWHWWYSITLRCKSQGMVVISIAHYIDHCSVTILNILEYPKISKIILEYPRIIANFHFFLSVVWFPVFSRWLSSSPGKFGRQSIPF